jgi:enediyne biosynthesis protein E4
MIHLPAGLRTWLTPRRLLAMALLAPTLGWGLVWGVETRWYRGELERAQADVNADRTGQARQRLARLAARWPGRGEVEYPLGVCEAALGHIDAALDAWARVPADSPFANDAALDRARLALQHGRLAVAEESLALVLPKTGSVGDKASRLARQLDLFSGRSYRINERIEQHWATAADQAAELQAHWLFDARPPPMGPIGE